VAALKFALFMQDIVSSKQQFFLVLAVNGLVRDLMYAALTTKAM
jgi:hypothetical protein